MLLDTHALLWLLSGDERLSESARERFERTDRVYYSVVSMWEIGLKLALRRKDFALDPQWWQEIPKALRLQSVEAVAVEPEDCRDVGRLPLHHRDPFDRMLVVQAFRLECPLLSRDLVLDAYGVQRLW